jgi:hypothetical protein
LAVIVSTDTQLSYLLPINKLHNSHAPNHGHAPIADLQLDAFYPADLVELGPKALAEGAEDTAAPRLSPLRSGLKKQEFRNPPTKSRVLGILARHSLARHSRIPLPNNFDSRTFM